MNKNISIDENEVEEVLNKEIKQVSTKDEMIEKFKEIDNDNSNNERDSASTLPLKEVEELSDEEIEMLAKESLNAYYVTQKSDINNDVFEDVSKLSSKIIDLSEDAQNEKSTLNSKIQDAKIVAKNKSIKNGTARSSIIDGQLEFLDNKLESGITSIENNLNNDIEKINFQINALNKNLEESLQNFDLTYAVKLQEKITKLKEEQAKKVEEVLEYNNKITQQEKMQDSENSNKDLSNNVEMRKIYEQKFALASEYFNSMPKALALEELLKTDFEYYKRQLGTYFYKLYSQIKNREK